MMMTCLHDVAPESRGEEVETLVTISSNGNAWTTEPDAAAPLVRSNVSLDSTLSHLLKRHQPKTIFLATFLSGHKCFLCEPRFLALSKHNFAPVGSWQVSTCPAYQGYS